MPATDHMCRVVAKSRRRLNYAACRRLMRRLEWQKEYHSVTIDSIFWLFGSPLVNLSNMYENVTCGPSQMPYTADLLSCSRVARLSCIHVDCRLRCVPGIHWFCSFPQLHLIYITLNVYVWWQLHTVLTVYYLPLQQLKVNDQARLCASVNPTVHCTNMSRASSR